MSDKPFKWTMTLALISMGLGFVLGPVSDNLAGLFILLGYILVGILLGMMVWDV